MVTNIKNKLVPLESVRGMAAVVVVLFHFVLGFAPQRHGQDAAIAIVGGNLKETPLFFLINGHAAVTFFFVLSGFILSYKYFMNKSNDGLAQSAVKRWPRLIILPLISTILSVLFIKLDLYTYLDVSKITNSNWMASFAKARGDYLNSNFLDAFMQGSFYTFFRGDENLNTSLWTMQYEFIGSLLVFALIPLFNLQKKVAVIFLFFIFMILSYYINIFMCSFTIGVCLSYFYSQAPKFSNYKIMIPFNLIGAIFVVLTYGYLEPGTGFYSFMNDFNQNYATSVRVLLHSLASVILIHLILNVNFLYNSLDNKLGYLLGKCSFALYVIHVPILFTFSTYIFLKLDSVFITFILTMPVLFLCAWGLSFIDDYWVRFVNKITKKIC